MESIIRERIKNDFSIDNKLKNTVCGIPKNMLLEVTNACNDSCLFCANSKCTSQRGIIDLNFAKEILKQAYDWGIREVGFYGRGESLLDKNLEKYVSYAKDLGYEYIYITTNGALMTKERADAIVEAGIDSIKFSINGADKKEYLQIHGQDDFDMVMRNLIYLSSLKEKEDFALYISYVVTRYNYLNKDKFKDKYQKYVDDIVFYDCLNTAATMTLELKNYLSMEENITDQHREGNICPMIFKTLYVTYDGYLTMCCADYQNYLAVADLKKEDLAEAWNNQYAQELRRRHLEQDLDGTLCFNCMKNCVGNVSPLRQEYAVIFDPYKWDKSAEIDLRVKNKILQA